MLLALTSHQPAGKAGYGASGVLQILMRHHIRCSNPVLAGSCDPAWLHLTGGYGAVGCPELRGTFPPLPSCGLTSHPEAILPCLAG